MENHQIQNRSLQQFDGLIKERSINEIQSNLSSSVNRSGNSDVDVNVNIQVDTMPIALSLLCLSFANKQLSRQEFETAIKELEKVTRRYKKPEEKIKELSKVKLFNENRSNRIWGG
ncbi:hypothetical protein ABES25_09285 [Bacillus gobiensis]|uniref:hypothetical protein n=1 Tax=Bacillus gobiensis TaxID=1441095 RepID=UPI003D21EB0C